MKTRKEIMTRAHEIARTLNGSYSARMSYSLKKSWEESRMTLTSQLEEYLDFKFESPSDSRISELYLTKTITVKYSDYKNHLDRFGYTVKKGAYNASNKTIELTIKMSAFWDDETVEEMIARKVSEKPNFELSKNFGRIERLVIGNNFSNYKEIKEAIEKCTIL